MNIDHFVTLANATLTGEGDSHQHSLTIFAIVAQLKATKILELGVREGCTTFPLLCGATLTNGMVESVDIEQTPYVCPDELKPHWQFHQSDAIAFLEAKVAENARYDLVYVDDWHSYDHVKRELELIDLITGPRSIILLHDLMYGNSQPNYRSDLNTSDEQWANGGPYRAVAELNPSLWEFATIPVNHGLTILRKKAWIQA